MNLQKDHRNFMSLKISEKRKQSNKRQALFRKKMIEKGFFFFAHWIPESKRKEITEFAIKICE
jgi:hypothetical protein